MHACELQVYKLSGHANVADHLQSIGVTSWVKACQFLGIGILDMKFHRERETP